MSQLGRKWSLWYHGNNNIWEDESYHHISSIESVEEFWKIMTNLKSYYLQNGWFFLMLDGVFPSWEKNPKGGSWSFRVGKKDVQKAWNEISIYLTSENLTNSLENNRKIIGISISPKKTFSIIKVWVNDHLEKDSIQLAKSMRYFKLDDAIYRPHHDNLLREKGEEQ